jgi:hypothetical protein
MVTGLSAGVLAALLALLAVAWAGGRGRGRVAPQGVPA